MIQAYKPIITFEQIMAFCSEDETTHTQSPIVNAVLEILEKGTVLDCAEVAEILDLNGRKLSHAIEVELGIPLKTLVKRYKIEQITRYVEENPKESMDKVAKRFGYASDSTLWRLFSRTKKETPRGKVSDAGPDWKTEMRKTVKQMREKELL